MKLALAVPLFLPSPPFTSNHPPRLSPCTCVRPLVTPSTQFPPPPSAPAGTTVGVGIREGEPPYDIAYEEVERIIAVRASPGISMDLHGSPPSMTFHGLP